MTVTTCLGGLCTGVPRPPCRLWVSPEGRNFGSGTYSLSSQLMGRTVGSHGPMQSSRGDLFMFLDCVASSEPPCYLGDLLAS